MPQRPDFGHGFCSGSSPSQGRVLITGTPAAGAFDPVRCGGALQKLSPCGSRLWAVFHAGNSSRCAAVLQVFCRNPARCDRNSSPQAALCVSQPELGGNQIVRFVTKQAPAPQSRNHHFQAIAGSSPPRCSASLHVDPPLKKGDTLSMPFLRVCAPTPSGFSQCGFCGVSAQDLDLRSCVRRISAGSGAS